MKEWFVPWTEQELCDLKRRNPHLRVVSVLLATGGSAKGLLNPSAGPQCIICCDGYRVYPSKDIIAIHELPETSPTSHV